MQAYKFYVIILNRSGSMEGGPIKKASEALQLLLRSLPEDCFFNVLSFGSHFDSLFKKSQPYSEDSFLRAFKHAQEMTANYGGTEIYSPIEWVLKNSRNDMPTSVFLLTDGKVNNVDQIAKLIKSSEKKKKDDLRFFSIGIGDSVCHNLVESVSRAGKGYAQFVTNNERMDKKILGMLKNAIKPPIKDYHITWTNQTFENVLSKKAKSVKMDKPTISFFSDNSEPPPVAQNIFTAIKVQQAPFLIPPIYPGARFIVYCILEKDVEACKEIILSAKSHDGPMKLSIPIDPVILQGSKLHTLAARKLIQDLDDRTSFIHKHPKNSGKQIPVSFIREQIVKLGAKTSMYSTRSLESHESFKFAGKTNVHDNIPPVQTLSLTITDEQKSTLSTKDDNVPFREKEIKLITGKQQTDKIVRRQVGKVCCKDSNMVPAPSQLACLTLPPFNINKLPSNANIPKHSNPNIKSKTPTAPSRMVITPPPKFSKPTLIQSKPAKTEESSERLAYHHSALNHRRETKAKRCNPNAVSKTNCTSLYNEPVVTAFEATSEKMNPSTIVTLYNFLEFQSFDDFENIGIENEKVLCLALATAYLELIMFKTFKEECEICYEKSKKALKKEVDDDEQKSNEILKKVKGWVNKWVNE
ncbi:19470_t:CDS:2 [Racocetra fulgida]|uniref:19470_t:CDS:1 n=1 Tax=Racocetra fulgida TaxID=60492 RepID=A0A9N9FKV0_9GLOM|nr:19470_t:CDS:2 [Racocetra fulgida]